MAQDKRNLYTKPELIVLQRNKPQESVLTACKNHGAPFCEPTAKSASSSMVKSFSVDPGIPTVTVGNSTDYCQCLVKSPCGSECFQRFNS